MDNQRYTFSDLNDNDLYNNKVGISSQENNKFLNLPKIIQRNPSFKSDKTRHSSVINLKNLEQEIYKYPKLIHNKVKQYELHPFRQLNLKIIGQDIKNKIYEMNKENILDTHLKNFEHSTIGIMKNSFLLKMKHKLNIEKSENQSSNLTESNNNINQEKIGLNVKDKSDNKNEKNEIKKICLEIPQHINKKKRRRKTQLYLESKKLIRERRLNRTKNLYDSVDDDESGKEEDEYVINPETNIIAFFDFLMVAFFLYYFIFTTFSLIKEKCFCPINKKITISDVLFFINDILCILDLILSFFRGYYNINYKLIKSCSLILKHYLKYDFIFDLLSAIPIFSIIKYNCLKEGYNEKCFKYEMSNKYIILKLCSLLKATKIKKISGPKKNQALDRLIESISDNYNVEQTVIIFIQSLEYIGIFHFLVCIHIFIGFHSYSNWLIMTQSENESLINIYIKSLYFIVTSLTTVGYGDIYCQSLLERIFQIIILIIGSVFYPYVVSKIGNIIKNDSNAKIKLDNNLAMLEHIRRNYPNMTFKLYKKIHKYLESKSSSLQKNDINSFIESLPFSMKNNILFTMYKSTISNFKFFKNNNNSVFIAEVLNNFIPSVSKKNEFLIYEGEMFEEIIFLKDGKIALNAAINTENPLKSIKKYFTESFAPFSTEEEKKLIKENMNMKSNLSAQGEMTYDKAKNKLNDAFKNIRNEKIGEEKSQLLIQTYINNKTQNFEFDMNAGAIINDEGNYQYLKIIDIRKNEHFGYVFMTLNKPCPLSLQVKSKLAELYLLKKERAMNLSKRYPNIWKKIYGREFHNLRTIKKYTFSVLKKYIEINEIFINNNFNDFKLTNNVSIFDLNILEKTDLDNKSIIKSKIQKSIITKQGDLIKNTMLNNEYDNNTKKLNLEENNTNTRSKLPKNSLVGNKNLTNNNLSQSNSNRLSLKSGQFLSPNYKSNNSGKNNNFNNNLKSNIKGTKFYNKNNFEKKESIQDIKKQKMKNLKIFLIECKKYFMNNKNLNPLNSYRSNNENNYLSISNNQIKKSCLKKNIPDAVNCKINDIKNNKLCNASNKSVEFDLSSNYETNFNLNNNNNNKFLMNEKLVKDLKDICENESNFSFCSTKEENNSKFNNLSINKNTNFEIASSYSNLNQLTKGKYIKDILFQKKLQFIIKKHYKDNQNEIHINKSKHKKHLSNSPNQKSQKFKKKKKEKYNTFYGNDNLRKKINKGKIKVEKANKTEIRNKKSSKNKELNNDDLEINNNLEYDPTLKIENSNLSDNQSSEIVDSNSVKANKGSSFSKKSGKEHSKIISNKDYFDNNIKNIKNIHNNNDEVEYIIDKSLNKDNTINKINSINNLNSNLYKSKKIKNIISSKYNNKNNELINQMIGIKIPNSNIITNNIITTSTSNLKDNKNDFNSIEKIKNIENLSIYNIIQKNFNKNLNIIENKNNDNELSNNRIYSKNFCAIF